MEQATIIKRDGTKINLVSKDPFRAPTSFSQEYGLKSDDYVKVSLKSSDMLKFGIGDRIVIGSDTYTIRTNNTTEIISDNSYTYELTFYGAMYDLMRQMYRNCDAQGKSDKSTFDLTYTLKDFAKVIIYNMERDYPGEWVLDENNVPDTTEKTITFDVQNCLQVLQTLCNSDNYDYDFLITQADGVHTLHLGKFGSVITPPNNESYFEVGKGKGLYKLKEDKIDDKSIITRLYVEGGSTNIRSEYRNYAGRLQLPYPQRANTRSHTLSDGTVISAGSMTIGITDDTKRYFEDADLKNKIGSIEDYDKTDDIFPSRTGKVTALGADVYSFVDDTMDFDLNEKDSNGTKWLIADTTAKITFTSGYLAGQQFELKKSGGYVHATKTFSLIKYTDEHGMSFPSETSESFQICVGDTYKITDINLPTAYENDAEEDLWFYGYDKFLQAKQARVQYTATFTEDFFLCHLPIDSTADIFHVGDYLPIKDTRFGVEKNIRIVKVTRNLMKQYDYTLTVSDTNSETIASQIVDEVISHETIINRYGMKDPSKARRGWRTTEDLRNMVFDTDGYFDGTNIKPNSIDTNMLTVGSKSQQFVLVGITLQANVNGLPNRFDASDGILAHLTIDENSIKIWNLTAASVTLAESGGYYVYAKCNKSGNTGSYYITQEQLKFEPATDSDNYYFLIGIIGSLHADDNFRDFSTTYGFTRINGRTITTGRIISSDGYCYLDLDSNLFQLADAETIAKATAGIGWSNGQLIIKGVLVQNQGGTTAELGLYRGTYNSSTIYYKGDEVSYNDGSQTCTYRYTGQTASSGNIPTNTTYWNIIAQGKQGISGVGIKSITNFYQASELSTGITSSTGTWSTTIPTLTSSLAYLWNYEKIEYTDGSNITTVAHIISGLNANIKSVVELFNKTNSATSSEGPGWITTPYAINANERYLWNKEKITYNDGSVSYTNPKIIGVYGDKGDQGIQGIQGIQGDKGDQGVAGVNGSDGKTSYFHIKYSDYADGTNMNETGGKYIGTYVDYTETDSTDKTKYKWVLVKGSQGDKGDQGIAGVNGVDGKTSYLHIAYANSADGITDFSVSDSVNKLYIGQYTDFILADSTDNRLYKWTLIKGADGSDGNNGTDGITDENTEFYEYRYAKNGSTTTPPDLDTTASEPSGWSKTMPSIGNLEYLWVTIAKKSSLVDHTIAHLPVSASDTSSIADTVGSYNGTYSDGASLQSENDRYSMALNGTGNIRIPLDLPWGKSFTLCFWVKSDQSSLSWMLNCYMGREYLEQKISLTPLSWYHLAFRFNNKTITVFKDGTEIYSGSTKNVHAGFSIYDDNLFATNAWFDEIRIFNSAISTGDIAKVIAGSADNLIVNWSTPIRTNGADGAKGDKGDKGENPVLVFRGVYDSSKIYYGTTTRLDAVKYNGVYYIARIDAVSIFNILPTDTSKWNSFGAQFESVATQLLLAEEANIAGWIFRNNRLESTDGNVYLDGNNGCIVINGTGSKLISETGEIVFGNDSFKTVFRSLSEDKTVQVNGGINSYVEQAYTFAFKQNRKISIVNSTPSSSSDWLNISVADIMDIDYHSKSSTSDPANRYGYQFATLGSGHIVMDGIVEGACIDIVNGFSANNQIMLIQPPLWCNRIAINSNYAFDVVVLPDLQSISSTLGCGIIKTATRQKFSFVMSFINIGNNHAYICGYSNEIIDNNTPLANDAFPKLYVDGNQITGLKSLTLYTKQIIQVMLIYDGTNYMAFVIK